MLACVIANYKQKAAACISACRSDLRVIIKQEEEEEEQQHQGNSSLYYCLARPHSLQKHPR
jgi:hypothetical protein